VINELAKRTYTLISGAQSSCPTIIFGLSGGPDSVFLLHVLNLLHQEKKINLIAAHLNHGWRKESDGDAQFCIDLCQKLKIPLIVKHAQELQSPRYNGSLEEVGRLLRRSFFSSLLEEHNALCIALAHHRQDQQETFLMRLMRGSSLSGLCCMKEIDAPYIRPLLHVNKKDIVLYLEMHAIAYCIDHTNQSPQFLRNRIRHTVLEPLRAVDCRCDEKFDTTVAMLQEEDAYLNRIAHEQFALIFTKNTEDIWLCDVKKFMQCDLVLQRRLLMYWFIQEKIFFPVSHAFMQEVIRFLISPRGGTHDILHNVVLYKKNNIAWIKRG
jgi:tRNA(Ile)-lysidine synthase